MRRLPRGVVNRAVWWSWTVTTLRRLGIFLQVSGRGLRITWARRLRLSVSRGPTSVREPWRHPALVLRLPTVQLLSRWTLVLMLPLQLPIVRVRRSLWRRGRRRCVRGFHLPPLISLCVWLAPLRVAEEVSAGTVLCRVVSARSLGRSQPMASSLVACLMIRGRRFALRQRKCRS